MDGSSSPARPAYSVGGARLPQATVTASLAADARTITKYLPVVSVSIGTVADDVARPSRPTLAAWYASAEPNTPSSDSHCPRCSYHGCSPPGVALARSSDTVVLPLLVPGAMEAKPFIWTARTAPNPTHLHSPRM